MTIRSLILLPALLLSAASAPPDELRPQSCETPQQFAARALGQGEANIDLLDTHWNGRHTLFADYLVPFRDGGETYNNNELVALEERPDGAYRRIAITIGEQEGGDAEVAAIAFANADRDPARELVVILSWPVIHYDVGGTLYEVRIFDTPHPGAASLALLPLSEHFGEGCDCTERDGPRRTYRFKTVASVRAELHRLGY